MEQFGNSGKDYEASSSIDRERMLFANLLREAKSKMGKDFEQRALKLGLSFRSRYKWENEGDLPGEDKLQNIAEAYGVDRQTLSETFRISRAAREREKGNNIRVDKRSLNK